MPKEADFYTPGEAAKFLGLAEITVLGLLTSGQLEGHQDERARWLIPASAIHAARHSSEASASTDPSIEQTIPIAAAPVSSTDSPATTASEDVGEHAGEHTGEHYEERADTSSSSGYTSTKQAAKVLGVSRRTVQSYVRRGELEAMVEGEGVEKTFFVSINSLNALRERRRNAGEGTSEFADNASMASSSSGLSAKAAQGIGEDAPNLIEVVQDLQYRLGRAEAKVELTERTESTLREQLAHERERANRLEAELREARGSTPEPRDAAERAVEDVSDSKTPSSDTEEPRRSWWQRWFGLE
jgi:excisionase family DNA binding protein